MSKETELKLKCISLVGELSDWGKHVYFPEMGVTMCGCFTIDYDKEKFKGMPEDMPSEYKVEEWDITCEKCLEMMDLMEGISNGKKAQQN